MRKKTKRLLKSSWGAAIAAPAVSLFLCSSLAHSQSVVFEADFDSSTAVIGSVTANATAANLDSGTAVGSWTADTSAPGAVISNGTGNHSFVFDKVTSGLSSNSVTADFSESVALDNHTLTLEMDLYAVRQANNQIVYFSLDDASGTQAYQFGFQMNNTKKFLATDSTGTSTISSANATGVNNGFKNPAVDGYLSWNTASMVHVKLELSGATSLSGSHEAELSIDWNADGDYADDSEWTTVNIGPKSYGVDEISSLRIFNDDSVNGGAWIDNLTVTSSSWVPAASTRGPFNLAKYQATTADSANGTWPTQFATDGFVTQDSRWVSGSSGPHWLQVDLAVPMTVGSAHLFSGGTWNTPMSNFVMQYDSGSGWTDIPGTARSGNTAVEQNLLFDTPVTAQSFRLYSTDGTARVIELALYAPTDDGSPVPLGTDVDLNFAKMRQYDYSSVDGDNYPKLAIDGYAHDSSAWASANTAGPHDLEIHLHYAEEIGGIHLYSGYQGQIGSQISDFEVAYESDGNWVTFDGGSITGNTEFDRSVRFNTPVKTTKIRFRSLDSTQAIVRELVVLPEIEDPWFPLGTDASDEAPPSASFLDYEDSYHTIENRSEGTRLSSSETGSVLTSDEPWFQVLLNLGTDSYRIRSHSTEKCFEVSLASTAAGAAIVEGEYSSMPHQRWQLVPVDGTYFQIVNVWSGLVLGVDGTQVVQQEPDGSTSQQWKINYQTHYPKKGQASHFHFSSLFKPSWGYRWNYDEEDSLLHGQYMPMQWGAMAASSPAILRYQPTWYGRAKQTSLLGFNEPDLDDQSNMTEETAAYQWPRLERTRLPLVGPVPAAYKGSWRQNYEAMADEQGLRAEYMAVHWYSPNGASTGSPSTLISNMEYLYNLYGKPIWLTEFSTRDFDGTKTTWSRADNFNFLAEFMWRAESLPWLKKYSVFEWSLYGGNPATDDTSSEDPFAMDSPRLALHISNDSNDPGWEDLSECGLLLAGWDGDATVRDDKAYIIHNKGGKMRLIDHPDESTVTSADILHRIATDQFMLQSASGGKKYIVGLSDGRRLHYDGSSVGLSPAGTTGTTVEWQLTEHEYGWFYIDHPATSKRLRLTDAGAVNVVNNTETYDNLRFRFITPALPISLTEVQSLPYAESFENGIGAWRQFYDDPYDWEVGTGGTPSSAAGPSGASDGDFYLFAEGHDSPDSGDVTQVECAFDFSSITTAELTFDYHMYGSYIDYLAVDIHDGTSWTTDVWFKDNQQHSSSEDPWSQATVDLSSYVGNPVVTIRFRTSRTTWNSADPAIDNIVVRELPRPLPYVETFEAGFGSWYQMADDDIDWTRNSGPTETTSSGPSGASEGSWYVYFEGHDSGVKNKSASLACTFDFSTVSSAQMTFDYHMYGAFIDYLTVDVFDGTTWSPALWTANGEQHSGSDEPWSTATVDLSAYAGLAEVTIRFTNKEITWHSADTAIDYIRVEEASSAYESWAATAFSGAPAGTDTSAAGNPDGDAYNNLVEWVLVLDPMKADAPNLSISESSTNLVVNYSRRTAGGLEVRAAWSTSLMADDWHYAGDGLTETVIETIDDVEVMSAAVPIDGSKKFIRLEVWPLED
ncbi:MAG: glycosyl hydrolase [Verrucomicrobiota bacterium JB025]|nr:glycosyl hydrolase [Verrucomicrobiota bacterium JB025]